MGQRTDWAVTLLVAPTVLGGIECLVGFEQQVAVGRLQGLRGTGNPGGEGAGEFLAFVLEAQGGKVYADKGKGPKYKGGNSGEPSSDEGHSHDK